MYIAKIKKSDKEKKKRTEYLVQYVDSESAEGLNEQFMRFYGLSDVIAGSFFYLGGPKNKADYDWSCFRLQNFSN